MMMYTCIHLRFTGDASPVNRRCTDKRYELGFDQEFTNESIEIRWEIEKFNKVQLLNLLNKVGFDQKSIDELPKSTPYLAGSINCYILYPVTWYCVFNSLVDF